jgi:hypothetical protein
VVQTGLELSQLDAYRESAVLGFRERGGSCRLGGKILDDHHDVVHFFKTWEKVGMELEIGEEKGEDRGTGMPFWGKKISQGFRLVLRNEGVCTLRLPFNHLIEGSPCVASRPPPFTN